MNKMFLRWVGVFLIPGLLVDPVMAASLGDSLSPISAVSSRKESPAFSTEAIVAGLAASTELGPRRLSSFIGMFQRFRKWIPGEKTPTATLRKDIGLTRDLGQNRTAIVTFGVGRSEVRRAADSQKPARTSSPARKTRVSGSSDLFSFRWKQIRPGRFVVNDDLATLVGAAVDLLPGLIDVFTKYAGTDKLQPRYRQIIQQYRKANRPNPMTIVPSVASWQPSPEIVLHFLGRFGAPSGNSYTMTDLRKLVVPGNILYPFSHLLEETPALSLERWAHEEHHLLWHTEKQLKPHYAARFESLFNELMAWSARVKLDEEARGALVRVGPRATTFRQALIASMRPEYRDVEAEEFWVRQADEPDFMPISRDIQYFFLRMFIDIAGKKRGRLLHAQLNRAELANANLRERARAEAAKDMKGVERLVSSMTRALLRLGKIRAAGPVTVMAVSLIGGLTDVQFSWPNLWLLGMGAGIWGVITVRQQIVGWIRQVLPAKISLEKLVRQAA